MATLSPRHALKAMESMADEKKEEEANASQSALEGESQSEMAGLSLFCDERRENATLTSVVDIALLDIDNKTGREVLNRSNKWTIHKCKDKNISVVYRKMPNEKNITLRSSMDINVGINAIHEFFRCDINDDLRLALQVDKMLKSCNVAKIFDKDRCVVHSSFTTGIPKSLVKRRDFCWMKRRLKYDNYVHPSKRVKKANEIKRGENIETNGASIAGIVCYSVDESHPNYVQKLKKHVRGWINFSGMIFVGKSENVCRMYYVLSVDPCGKIPKAIINICAPQQGMNIKHFADNIDKAKDMLAKRKKSVAL